jgi:hypothetical protein
LPRPAFLLESAAQWTFAASAAADEAGAPAPVKAPAHVARTKARAKAVAPDGGFAAIKFSDPAAPLVGVARPPKPVPASTAAGAPQEPQGGPALALKWHADDQHIDNPYLPPWVPNGQGYNVQAGVKLGF